MTTARDFYFSTPAAALIRASAEYGCRDILRADTNARISNGSLRTHVADTLARLCLQRFLVDVSVPFRIDGTVKPSTSGQICLRIGGRACHPVNYFAYRPPQRSAFCEKPEALERAEVLVPFETLTAQDPGEHDLLIFSAVAVSIARNLFQTHCYLSRNEPVFLYTRLDTLLRNPCPEISICMENPDCTNLPCSLIGISRDGFRREERFSLSPAGKLRLDGWRSVAGLLTNTLPSGALLLTAGGTSTPVRIPPAQWINLWIYDCRHVIFGWATKNEFRRNARLLPAGASTWFYRRTRKINWALPIARLHPLSDIETVMTKMGLAGTGII